MCLCFSKTRYLQIGMFVLPYFGYRGCNFTFIISFFIRMTANAATNGSEIMTMHWNLVTIQFATENLRQLAGHSIRGHTTLRLVITVCVHVSLNPNMMIMWLRRWVSGGRFRTQLITGTIIFYFYPKNTKVLSMQCKKINY